MNKQFLKSIFGIAICVICIYLVGCQRKSVDLPNGYRIVPDGMNNTYIIKKNKQKIINDKVSQFCVDEQYVNGWIDGNDVAFFSLNTANGELKIFGGESELNKFLASLKRQPLNMRNSFTYLDIVTGNKRPNWKNK